MKTDPLRIFIGWDSREVRAYDVCVFSMTRRASIATDIRPLKEHELRAQGLYWRAPDPVAATEFAFTRFLVPALAGYEGWALFCDCDFLWLGDIAELSSHRDERFALMCVHHDYRPPEKVKMDGRIQTQFPRKNWSSMMLINCGHPSVARLTVEAVNSESGAWLHRFQWLENDEIGAVDETWNWLEGWSKIPDSGTPKAVHMTRGGPWFDNWQKVDYADLWLAEEAALEQARTAAAS